MKAIKAKVAEQCRHAWKKLYPPPRVLDAVAQGLSTTSSRRKRKGKGKARRFSIAERLAGTLIGPSGILLFGHTAADRTQTLLELQCQEWGVYLTCDSGQDGGGGTLLEASLKALTTPAGGHISYDDVVIACMRCILTWMAVLHWLREANSDDVTPAQWAAVQYRARALGADFLKPIATEVRQLTRAWKYNSLGWLDLSCQLNAGPFARRLRFVAIDKSQNLLDIPTDDDVYRPGPSTAFRAAVRASAMLGLTAILSGDRGSKADADVGAPGVATWGKVPSVIPIYMWM